MFSLRRLLIPVAVGAALTLAACGSSSSNSSSSSSAANTASPASQPAPASSKGLVIHTASAPVGTYLTGPSGRALYIWVADSKGRSSCSGACAAAWPPLIASSVPQVSGSVHAGDLSLISRSDGTKQVAYVGRPLYYYAGDSGAGTTNGQGSNQFGAKWWLISPGGGQVGASSSSASTSGSSGSSSGGGWG